MTLKIKNWERFQSKRKDRDGTPWIKFYRRALMSPTWHQMADYEKGQFLSLLLLADQDGKLATADATVLQRMGGMTEVLDIKRFIDIGLLDGAKLATKRKPNVTPEKEVEVEKEQNARARVSVGFQKFWDKYPHKVGKGAAEKAFHRTTAPLETLLAGIERYVRQKPPDVHWCHPATWLNQRRWEDEPAQTSKVVGFRADPPRRTWAEIKAELTGGVK